MIIITMIRHIEIPWWYSFYKSTWCCSILIIPSKRWRVNVKNGAKALILLFFSTNKKSEIDTFLFIYFLFYFLSGFTASFRGFFINFLLKTCVNSRYFDGSRKCKYGVYTNTTLILIEFFFFLKKYSIHEFNYNGGLPYFFSSISYVGQLVNVWV